MAVASDLDVIGDVFRQGHVKHDQRFPRHGGVSEGVAAAIRPHSPLQVSPVPDWVHRLIPRRKHKHVEFRAVFGTEIGYRSDIS